MCKICSEYQLGNLSKNEATRNALELEDDQHFYEVLDLLKVDILEFLNNQDNTNKVD